MCILFIAVSVHAGFKYIILSNRDEQISRDTSTAAFWEPDHANILAGRDNVRGGTWLGVTKQGRFSAVTNYRVPLHMLRRDARSRGELVVNFLKGNMTAREYLQQLIAISDEYDGFNLIVGDLSSDPTDAEGGLWYFSNKDPQKMPQKLLPGKVYGLSNSLLDVPWPKVTVGKSLLYNLNCDSGVKREAMIERCFAILRDKTPVEDKDLPDTGVGIEKERRYSTIFVEPFPDPVFGLYGTRSSTVILVDNCNGIQYIEKSLDPCLSQWNQKEFMFTFLSGEI